MARERIVKIVLDFSNAYDWVVTKSRNGARGQGRRLLRLAR